MEVKIKRALLSVSDKTGLIDFARALQSRGVELISTGGTLQSLQDAKIPARSVSDLTGFPEMLDGRIKTLHPLVHGGILYRRGQKEHEQTVKQHGISSIDLVVVNLYPFESVTARPETDLETAIENIDIGGPTLLRAAAKNYESVVVIIDPSDYGKVLEELKNKGSVSLETRFELSQKVYERTSQYDRMISNYLKRGQAAFLAKDTKKSSLSPSEGAPLPQKMNLNYEKVQDLRYGENPHQKGAFYKPVDGGCLDFKILHGKELSFNNLLDFDAAADILREFNEIAATVVKHLNPCGIALGKNLMEAFEKALASDPLSAFGGIVGLTRPCDLQTAKKIYELLNFLEIVVAPGYAPDALEFLKTRKNVRLLETNIEEAAPLDLKFIQSGLLLQEEDLPVRLRENEFRKNLKWVTKIQGGKEELEELIFAWKCVKTVKSNAIVITKDRQTVGIGGGYMSRVDSVRMACWKAGERSRGGFLASEAFFPMPDNIQLAKDAGIRALIQPGGSIKDNEVIQACDAAGIAMVLTGRRHFKH